MDKVSEMTSIRNCEACGQVKFPSDHWQRKLAEQKEQFRVLEDEMLVMMDERNEAEKALRVAVGLLSTMPQFSNMHPNDVLEGILKETREMK